MDELFYIRDYEDETILEVYITDNATKCYEIMQDIDSNDDLYEDLISRFEEECEKAKVNIIQVNRFQSYSY